MTADVPGKGCDCDDCRARWIGEVVMYAKRLEYGAVEAKRLIDGGVGQGAFAILAAMAVIARDRDLRGEIDAMMAEADLREAEEARAAGRLRLIAA